MLLLICTGFFDEKTIENDFFFILGLTHSTLMGKVRRGQFLFPLMP
jgi:hypothetical protein